MGRGAVDISKYRVDAKDLEWRSNGTDFRDYSGVKKPRYADLAMGMGDVLKEIGWALGANASIFVASMSYDADQTAAIKELLDSHFKGPSRLLRPVVYADGSKITTADEARRIAKSANRGILLLDGIGEAADDPCKILQRGASEGSYLMVAMAYLPANLLNSLKLISSGGVQQYVYDSPEIRDRFSKWAWAHARSAIKGADMGIEPEAISYLYDHLRANGGLKDRIESGVSSEAESLLLKAASNAKAAKRGVIGASDVRLAREIEIRSTISDERMSMELPEACSTCGAVVGSANGLAYVGVPVLGGYGVVIPLHISVSKGKGNLSLSNEENTILTDENDYFGQSKTEVANYLRNRYPRIFEKVGINASPVGEHNIGDGPSMSALLAAASELTLAGIPINQRYAVTGEFDPRGNVMRIGGEKQKVEGWMRSSAEKGDSSVHAAVLPAWNVRNLMLSDEAIQRVRDGRFEIYGVNTVGEIEEIISDGVPAEAVYRGGKAALSRKAVKT